MQRTLWTRRGWWLAGLALAIAGIGWGAGRLLPARAGEPSRSKAASAQTDASEDEWTLGRELFHRSWLPDDPRSPQGDGLGPMFNDTSCAACHNQGGPGGGGSSSKNVELLTAFVSQPMVFNGPGPATMPGGTSGPLPGGFGGGAVPFAGPAAPNQTGSTIPVVTPEQRKAITEELAKIHPEFRKSSSVVIHRFGTSPEHSQWREELLNQSQVPSPFLSPSAVNTLDTFPNPTTAFTSTAVATFEEPAPERNPAFQPADQQAPFAQAGEEVPTEGTPARVPADIPSDPPKVDSPVQEAPGQQFRPAPVAPPQQPIAQPQMVDQTFVLGGTSATGIPLVDQAIQEMERQRRGARQDVSGSINRGRVVLLRSQRNTSALFGSGLIDAIPDAVIEAAAQKTFEDYPRVKGRVHHLPDGKIGRFGWKAQKATLRDFTLAACANELGLDVPQHAQPPVPYGKQQERKGHDMTERETDALVAYVRDLPAPIQEVPDDKQAAEVIEDGRKLFESVGCAACHAADLGKAKGIYSDLLLHDMGEKLQASGSYGSSFTPQEFDPLTQEAPKVIGPEPKPDENAGPRSSAGRPRATAQREKPKGPAASEWRTPPLWGLRDSAPYLHDGRADTVEQAIAFHGGEGSDAAIRFFMMPTKKRQRILAFLNTLRARNNTPTADSAARQSERHGASCRSGFRGFRFMETRGSLAPSAHFCQHIH